MNKFCNILKVKILFSGIETLKSLKVGKSVLFVIQSLGKKYFLGTSIKQILEFSNVVKRWFRVGTLYNLLLFLILEKFPFEKKSKNQIVFR
ncbi:hypothetical protein LEP1GSC016_0810 [Leptospira borgpetersenii serovar Hardjo-bovis str. Sponselee]|uniref:Uncharacterized protein n=1 Tax=Leptospira borgpetersenii serovar Hardjo-bovis str. Sponselee TaxID=1303729 RepID=M6CEZ4_LEPBO|nr:hypothetical protein LBK6_10855 [Leptospira borgpetersenii serovar Hardjo]AWV70605.1 hypothetical protein B9T54_11735 [Leptospira borgpetersenii serovar Hardjo-bovis]EMJ84825.1 hypothetical protein LEP1GSC016_0810 [Leptospira borgpetersenii serovar Hardjo-bovis str. Sponselee]TQE54080.1 hypothetical protein FFZ95_05345 [Leptospira borgpetersenii]AMX62066.1 hypothetical protein LBK9_10895 [Leptospira borgpetersenii serovar Hardjo]